MKMNWTGRLRPAKNRARAGRKFQRKPRLQNGALKPYLLPEVGTQDRKIVFCETSYYFILKVIAGSCNRLAVTLLVRRTAFLDRFFQTVVKIFVFPAFRDLGLIIEFDFVDQEARETLGFAVNILILRRDGRSSRRHGCCLAIRMTDRQRFSQCRAHFSFNDCGLNFGDRAMGGAGDWRRGLTRCRCCHGLTRGIRRSMRGKRIVESRRWLRWRLIWRRLGRRDAVTVHVRLRLLAKRVDLEPCAGRQQQQFERAGVERTGGTGSAVGIDHRRNFVFQNQGENPSLSARRRSQFLPDTGVQVGNRRDSRHTIADRMSDGWSVFIESEIFQRIAVGDAACLPSASMATLYDQQRYSDRLSRAGI